MVESCGYDGLPCERFVNELGFGVCYVKRLDGKLRFVCNRFKADNSGSIEESIVPSDLIRKSIER